MTEEKVMKAVRCNYCFRSGKGAWCRYEGDACPLSSTADEKRALAPVDSPSSGWVAMVEFSNGFGFCEKREFKVDAENEKKARIAVYVAIGTDSVGKITSIKKQPNVRRDPRGEQR